MHGGNLKSFPNSIIVIWKTCDVIKIHVTYTCIKPFKENNVLDGYARTKVTILYPSEAHFI